MLDLQKIFFGVAGAVPRLGSILGLNVPSLQADSAVVSQVSSPIVALTDGATVAVDAALGGTFVLTCASNATRAIQVPTNGVAGQRIVVRIINTSGGALSATTFAAGIRQPALTLPGNATQRDYELAFNGTSWGIYNFSPANVPN